MLTVCLFVSVLAGKGIRTEAAGAGYSGIIWIGDSRFVILDQVVVTKPDDIFIHEAGMYYDWFQDTAVPKLRKILNSDPSYQVVINMGVNDCQLRCCGEENYQAYNYVSLINSLIQEFPDTKFYFASVGHLDSDVEPVFVTAVRMNAFVDEFNDVMRSRCAASYLPLGEYLIENGFSTLDGIHFDEVTCKKIYDYVSGVLDGKKGSALPSGKKPVTPAAPAPVFSGMLARDGKIYCLENGAVSHYTGIGRYQGAWMIVKDGIAETSLYGLQWYEGKLYSLDGGRVDESSTGIFEKDGKRYFLYMGTMRTGFSGLMQEDGMIFRVRNGIVKEAWTEEEFRGLSPEKQSAPWIRNTRIITPETYSPQ